jgi:multidrug efflux pump subunit AcrA (membrane-fusion protein)
MMQLKTRPAVQPGRLTVEPDGRVTAPAPPARPTVRGRRSSWRWAMLGLVVLVGVVVGLAFVQRIGPFQPPAVSPTIEAPAPLKLLARGEVRPIGEARVGTLAGGIVHSLAVRVGDPVTEQQEIARIRTADSTEVLTAPWRGTVIGLPIHLGDTVTPGSLVAVIGDLRDLQVETNDVDEYVIAAIYPGQPVTVSVDALNRQELRGYVRTVSLYVLENEDGDDHYPVEIDLVGSTANLRPGMSVRVTFLVEE